MHIWFTNIWRSTYLLLTKCVCPCKRYGNENNIAARKLLPFFFTYIGPSVPLQPIDLVHSTLSSEFVEIQWQVTAIAYTPENYSVIYGRSQDLMNNTTGIISSTDDITKINQIYSFTLNGLDSNATYYYQVVSENTIGKNVSSIGELVTLLPSKYVCTNI